MPLTGKQLLALCSVFWFGASACRPERPTGEEFDPDMVNTGTAASRSEFESARVVSINGRDITVGEFERRLDSASSTADRYFAITQRRPNYVQLLVYLELVSAEMERLGLTGTSIERVMTLDAAARSAIEAIATENVALSPEIGADEVDAAYRANEAMFARSPVRRASVILLADRESALATRAQMLDDISVSDVVAGEVFAAAARRVSLDAGTRDAGGDLGFFQMPADASQADPITAIVFGLGDIPSVSEPIATAGGWALFIATSQIEPAAIDREQAGIWLREHLARERRQAAMQAVVAAAQHDIDVDVDQAVVAELTATRTANAADAALTPTAAVRPRRYALAGLSETPEQFYGESWQSMRSWYTPDPDREFSAAIMPVPEPLPAEGSGGMP